MLTIPEGQRKERAKGISDGSTHLSNDSWTPIISNILTLSDEALYRVVMSFGNDVLDTLSGANRENTHATPATLEGTSFKLDILATCEYLLLDCGAEASIFIYEPKPLITCVMPNNDFVGICRMPLVPGLSKPLLGRTRHPHCLDLARTIQSYFRELSDYFAQEENRIIQNLSYAEVRTQALEAGRRELAQIRSVAGVLYLFDGGTVFFDETDFQESFMGVVLDSTGNKIASHLTAVLLQLYDFVATNI